MEIIAKICRCFHNRQKTEKYLLQFETALLTDAPKGFEEQYKIFKEMNGLSVDMLIKEMGIREKYEQMEKDLLPIFKNKVNFAVSQMKESDAAILGAASLVWEN